MKSTELHKGVAGGDVEPIPDEELLRWAGEISKARGRVQAARDVGLNYRTLAHAIDEGQLTRHARETLLAAHRAESTPGAQAVTETGEELTRRIEAAESQLAAALDALEQERERSDALERRVELLEGQAVKPGTEMPAIDPEVESTRREPSTEREADALGSEAPANRNAQRAGVVTLEPLEGERATLGKAAALVAEWRWFRDGDARRWGAVNRARAEERRWELELALIGEHGLTLPPETEPLSPSHRADQLRWRRLTLGRARAARVRAERLRLLRRVLTLGIWWK
ncbi:MAG: hypothetical protein F4Y57_00715 [Acidobacteria bacterium]|nr:hypothetical protein [Acidobacteriota bacterium]